MREATGKSYTDDQINMMSQRNFDNYHMIETKWSNELSNQQDIQKREYRDWVIRVHEDTKGSSTPKYM